MVNAQVNNVKQYINQFFDLLKEAKWEKSTPVGTLNVLLLTFLLLLTVVPAFLHVTHKQFRNAIDGK